MKYTPVITARHLNNMNKGQLIKVIRRMEAYLCQMASANDEISWRGSPEDQQRAYTRSVAFKDAAEQLQAAARTDEVIADPELDRCRTRAQYLKGVHEKRNKRFRALLNPER